MKVLITWHAAVEPAYRKLFTELSLQGVKLLAVVPTCWTEGCRLQRFSEGVQDSYYEWTVLNTVFVNVGRVFAYPNIFALCRKVLRFKPDIIHIIEEPFCVSTVQFTLLRDTFCPKAKIILQSFENLDVQQRFPFGCIQDFNLRRANALIVVPKEGREIWKSRGFKGKIFNVPLGVDTEVFHPLEKSELSRDMPFSIANSGKFKVGYIGRLSEEKDIDSLIDAIHILKEMGRRVVLFIIGSGSSRKTLEEKVAALGLSNCVTFIDSLEQSELPLFFHHVDALVLPSITTRRWKEQFGRVLVEAMACKVPVVGSSSGEIPNVVGDAGLIFKEGDVKALSKSLDVLLRNEDVREQKALKGFQRVKEMYTWPAVARRLVGVYKEVLK